MKPSCLPVARSHKLISLSSELVQENVSCRLLEPNVLYLSFLVSWFSLSEFSLGFLSFYIRYGCSLGLLAKDKPQDFQNRWDASWGSRHAHSYNPHHPLQPPTPHFWLTLDISEPLAFIISHSLRGWKLVVEIGI